MANLPENQALVYNGNAMYFRQKIKEFFFAFGEILTFLFVAFSYAQDISGVGGINWRLSTLLGFFVFFILVLWHIISLNNQLKSRMPKLQIAEREGLENPYANNVNMQTSHHTEFTESGQYRKEKVCRMVHVKISNNPRSPNDLNTARDVRAELTYYDEGRNRLIGPIDGRWGDTREPVGLLPDERRKILSIDIPSNGDLRGLDIAMRYPEERECYAYNNESYFADEGFKKPEYKLVGEKFCVRVELRGQIFNRKRFWLTLLNLDDANTIKLIKGEK